MSISTPTSGECGIRVNPARATFLTETVNNNHQDAPEENQDDMGQAQVPHRWERPRRTKMTWVKPRCHLATMPHQSERPRRSEMMWINPKMVTMLTMVLAIARAPRCENWSTKRRKMRTPEDAISGPTTVVTRRRTSTSSSLSISLEKMMTRTVLSDIRAMETWARYTRGTSLTLRRRR
jgi:hypothetical protein